jgi:hypothetical protein
MQTLPETGFSAAGCREALHSLGVEDAAEFNLIDALICFLLVGLYKYLFFILIFFKH